MIPTLDIPLRLPIPPQDFKKKPPELQNRRPKLKDQVQQRKNKIIILFLQVKMANQYHYFVK